MAEKGEVSGRIERIDKNYANVSVSGHPGLARIDLPAARRITGSYVGDLRNILEKGDNLKVRVIAMSEEVLSKIPQHIRQAVRRNSQWEVKFFRKDIEYAPLPSQFNVPERHFEDSGSSTTVPRQSVGRIISALLQITSLLNNLSLSKLFPLVKTHFKVKGVPDIDRYLASEDELARFIRSFPQYFTISGDKVKRCSGFTEDVFDATLMRKATEIHPSSTGGRRPIGAGAAAGGDPADLKDVLSCTQIVDSIEECKRVLDPILRQSERETVVIGLDCEGVKLGSEKGCLTLVQISTWDGKAFLFDAYKNPQLLKGNSNLKKILEHDKILKVIHDCKSDTYSLYHGFGVKLRNIFDTSIAMRTIMEQLNRYRSFRIGFKALCETLGEGASHKDDDFVKKMIETPDFWKIRPLTEEMIYYAASDALCLVPSIYLKLNGMLTPLWRDFYTWWCKDTMESIQKPRQPSSNQGNRQRSTGNRPNSQRGRQRDQRRQPAASSYSQRHYVSVYDDDSDDDDSNDDFDLI